MSLRSHFFQSTGDHGKRVSGEKSDRRGDAHYVLSKFDNDDWKRVADQSGGQLLILALVGACQLSECSWLFGQFNQRAWQYGDKLKQRLALFGDRVQSHGI